MLELSKGVDVRSIKKGRNQVAYSLLSIREDAQTMLFEGLGLFPNP